MKAVVADYRYRCHGLRIVCTNGTTIRLTDYPRDLVMGSETYQSDTGYQFTGIQASAGMAAAVMDIEGIIDAAGVSRADVESGVFDGASLYAFATTWRAPTEDEEPIGKALFGKATISDSRYRVEIMQLIDVLNQSVGSTHGPGCDHEFGDAWCTKDLGALTVTGTLTHVTSGSVVRDSTRAEAADYFGAGKIRFTSGDNAGLGWLEIKSYAADGTVTTHEPFYYTPQVGDAYELAPGCRKRRTEDCRDKWDNVPHFFGFPDTPVSSQYQQVGTK